uniref:Uncharacterized protein n=1 Tax=Aegilops tauschii subsp. strangulata TaxID=200361 RepID=A0A452Z3Q9_AEGTS
MAEDGRERAEDAAETTKKAKQGGFRTMPFILGDCSIDPPYFQSSSVLSLSSSKATYARWDLLSAPTELASGFASGFH